MTYFFTVNNLAREHYPYKMVSSCSAHGVHFRDAGVAYFIPAGKSMPHIFKEEGRVKFK